jgi:predicted HTH domain antitoxin
MTTISLEVTIPSDLFILQKQSAQELTRQLQRWIAMLLFREYHLPATNAADIAGLSLTDFMMMVRQYEPLSPPPNKDNPLLQLIGIATGEPFAENIDDMLYDAETV